jgi:protein CpxP
MSDQSHTPSATGPNASRRRRRSWLMLAAVALASALTGAAASRAVSQQAWHGPPFMGGPFDPARVEEGADRAVRHLAIEIDATTDQQEKLRAIVKGAVKDLLPLREKAVAARARARGLFTQPTIDRAAIEALRAEQMALAETASKRFAQAIGDAAEALTPEQRRTIDDRLQQFREHRGFWHGWRRG